MDRSRDSEPAGDLAATAAAVCRRLLAEHDFDARADASRALTEHALAEFATHGLLGLRFLDTGTIAPGDMRSLARLLETLAAHSHTLTSIYLINAIFGAAAVAFFASAEQKQRLLPAVRAGRRQIAFALTEPGAGSDAAGITTVYRADGDAYVLNGTKIFTTGAAVADDLFVVARAEAADATAHTETIFIVPRAAAGMSIEPLPKLAGNAHASCRVRLENVRLDREAVLGGRAKLQQAWPILRRMGALERFAVAAIAVGLAAAVVERAVAHAKERRQFGQLIGGFQSIQFLLVDLKTLERTMRLLVDEAAAALESGADATFAVTSAKAYCAEKLQEIVAGGMRVLGGRAYFDFEPMARYYREAPWALYAGGTVEIQKRLAARAMGLG